MKKTENSLTMAWVAAIEEESQKQRGMRIKGGGWRHANERHDEKSGKWRQPNRRHDANMTNHDRASSLQRLECLPLLSFDFGIGEDIECKKGARGSNRHNNKLKMKI